MTSTSTTSVYTSTRIGIGGSRPTRPSAMCRCGMNWPRCWCCMWPTGARPSCCSGAESGGELQDLRGSLGRALTNAKITKNVTWHVFRHTYRSMRLQTLDNGEPISTYTVECATCQIPHTSVTGYRRPVPALTSPATSSTSPARPRTPFFQEHLGELQLHRQFSDLRLRVSQRPFVRIS